MKEEKGRVVVTNEDLIAETDKYRHWQRASEIKLAMEIAKSRDRFRWGLGYFFTITLGTIARWAHKSSFPVAMLLPISAVGYYCLWEYDLGYGTKITRANLEAHRILNKERYKYFGKF